MNRYTNNNINNNRKNKKIKKRTNKHRKQKVDTLLFGGNILDEVPVGGRRHRQKYKQSHNSMRPMNCNPQVKGKTLDSSSCLTNDALQKLKNSYNREHSTRKITSTQPKMIWSDLKARMTKCKKEDCWLDVINDPIQRNELDKQLFAPDMPSEWKSKPNTWLSNFDIMAVLEQYQESHKNFRMIGPTPIDFDTRPPEKNGKCVWDEICMFSLKHYLDKGKTKIGIVFNLDKHDQGGSHWVSLFLDLEDQFMFFLDSAGEEMPKEIKALTDRISKQGLEQSQPMHIHIYQNCPTEHQMGNTEFGVYSLFFIITMLTNQADGKKFSNFMEKVRFFKDKRIPDKYVEKYRKLYFNE
jgi:hypothetical protein